jgi:hypothetical protein
MADEAAAVLEEAAAPGVETQEDRKNAAAVKAATPKIAGTGPAELTRFFIHFSFSYFVRAAHFSSGKSNFW